MPAGLASPRCCPTAGRLTTAEPPLERTSSNAQGSHTTAENPDGCDTPTASLWTFDTSMSCHSQTAPFASTTKPGFPTRATNCAPKSSRPKPDMDKRLTKGWILGLRDDAQASVVAQEGPQLLHPGPLLTIIHPRGGRCIIRSPLSRTCIRPRSSERVSYARAWASSFRT